MGAYNALPDYSQSNRRGQLDFVIPWAIIHPVKRFTNAWVLVRLLIPLILLALSGIAPRPHALTQALHQALLGLQATSSPQVAARSAYALAQQAEQLPWRTDLWEPAGHLALKGGDLQAAIQFLERAAAQNSLSPAGQVMLGDAYAASGEQPAAIQAWEAALKVQGSSVEVLTRLLKSHRAVGDYPAAIADLKALTTLQPTDSALRYQLGLLLASQQPEAALAHLAQAAELNPNLAEQVNKLVEAIRTGSLAGDPAQTLFEAGRALASNGEWELAAEAFHQATLARPDFADAWAFWGEARQHLQSDPLSQPVPPELEKALSLNPSSLSANTLMALYYQRRARFDQALVYLRKVTDLYPQNPDLQVELGEVLALSGDLPGALQSYQKAIELAPQDALYQRLLAGFCIRHETHLQDVGLPAARRAVILNAQDPDNLDVLGQALFLQGDLTNAERFFQRALEMEAEYTQAHLHLGLVYALQGERSLARQEWELVMAQAPGSAAAEQAGRLIKNYFP